MLIIKKKYVIEYLSTIGLLGSYPIKSPEVTLQYAVKVRPQSLY